MRGSIFSNGLDMARERPRPDLVIEDVLGLFKQAFLSCRSCIWLFLTLALLSSVYETAVERSAIIPGITFSSPNSTFSFQFSFDPNQPAQASQLHRSTDDTAGVSAPDNIPLKEESFLSRFWSMILSSDPFVALEESPMVSPGEPPKDGSTSLFGSENEDSVHEGYKRDGDEVSGDVNGKDQHDDQGYQSEGLRDTFFSDDPLLEKGGIPEIITENSLAEDLSESSSSDYDDSLEDVELLNNDIDEPEVDSGPRLKLQTLGNGTKKVAEDFLDETSDLMFFTGRLLGGRGLDQGAMPHGGMTMLLMFLILTGALTIFLGVVGFQHAAVLGSVAYSIVSTHMGKVVTTRRAIRAGFKSGIGRLMWLAILHATLRGLQSLFFMKTLFGGVMEMEQVEQLVLRLSVTPFAFLAPFRDADATDLGMAVRIGLFVGVDYLFDGVAYCVYVVACWVTIIERNFWGLGALSRSWNLVKSMEMQAVVVKALEAMVCGRSSRWLFQKVLGHFLAAFVICTAQVYFLVLWLIFYFSARSIHDGSSRFSYRHLEDFLDRFK